MQLEIFHVDAFTSKIFSGNPAAVCVLDGPREVSWMKNVAQEMNLSETAFLLRNEKGYGLRWFTPLVEVDLCGHATLASAHVLWEQNICSSSEPISFSTRSGILTARKNGDWIALDLPCISNEPVRPPPALLEALKVVPVCVRRKGQSDFLVEVDSESTLRSLSPDMTILKRLAKGVVITCRSESQDFDFLSRFFAPQEGIDEDPVTGSAHCCLGPYWKEKLGKNEFTAFQASARGGLLKVKVVGDRVMLEGQAVTVLQGKLLSHL